MNPGEILVAFVLCLATGCTGNTFVGELFPRATGDASTDGDDAKESSDAGGGLIESGSGGTGGIATPVPTELILQPSPEASEDFALLTVNGGARPVDSTTDSFGVETSTMDGAPVVRRSLIRFRIPFQLEPSQVLQAHLVLSHQPDRVAHVVGTAWRIGRAVGAWEASSLTWANQPEAHDVFSPPPPDSLRADFRIDVSTLVRAALAAQESPAFTLRLVDESIVGQRVMFCASDHDLRACRPALHLALSLHP